MELSVHIACAPEYMHGENLIAATKNEKSLITEEIEEHTTFFKKGNIELSKTIYRFAYIENEKPEYLNTVIDNNKASRIITLVSELH